MTGSGNLASIKVGCYAKDTTKVADGMVVHRVALFDTNLGGGDIAAYKFPSESEQCSATVSGSVNWSNITWDKSLAPVNPTNAYVTLTLDADAEIVFDKPLTLRQLTLTGAHQATLNYQTSLNVLQGVVAEGGATVVRRLPAETTQDKTAALTVPAGEAWIIEGGADTVHEWSSITVVGTLQTSGKLNFQAGGLNAAGTLEVTAGELSFNATGSLSGTLTIDSGATFVNTRAADALNYGGNPTVNVKGTLSMGETRWTVGGNNKINLYPGCTVSGAGQSTNGALDFYQANTNFKVAADGGNTDDVNLSAALRFRDSGDATLNVGAPVTVNVSGALYGGKTFTLAGVEGSVVALSSGTINSALAAGAGVTFAPTVAVPKLTLNEGATVRPNAGGLTVGTAFTKVGAYTIDGSLVLADTNLTYTLVTAPSAPSIDGVVAKDADGRTWDLLVEGNAIKAEYPLERQELHWDAQSGAWVDENGTAVTPSRRNIIVFKEDDAVSLTADVTAYSAYVADGVTASLAGQSHLKVGELAIPADATFSLKSNELPGFAVVGEGTLVWDPGLNQDLGTGIATANFSGFAGTFHVKTGRYAADAAAVIPAEVDVKVTDGGQLWAKAGTWANAFVLSGNGRKSGNNAVEYAALRLDGTLDATGSVEFRVEDDVVPCIGTTESTGRVAGTLSGTAGFDKRGSGTLTVSNIAQDNLHGTVRILQGTLKLGNNSAGTVTLGEKLVVTNNTTLVLAMSSGNDYPNVVGTELELQGGTVSYEDGSFRFAKVNVTGNASITPKYDKVQKIDYLTGTAQLTLGWQRTAYGSKPWTIAAGDFSGALVLSGDQGNPTACPVTVIPTGTALENATVTFGNVYSGLSLNGDATVGSVGGSASGISGTGTLTLKGGTVSGVISGEMGLAVAGDVTLAGTNTYTGATTVSSGTLTVGGTLASSVSVAAEAAVDVGQNHVLTVGGEGSVKAALTDEEYEAGAATLFAIPNGAAVPTVSQVLYGGEDITAKCTIEGNRIKAIQKGSKEIMPGTVTPTEVTAASAEAAVEGYVVSTALECPNSVVTPTVYQGYFKVVATLKEGTENTYILTAELDPEKVSVEPVVVQLAGSLADVAAGTATTVAVTSATPGLYYFVQYAGDLNQLTWSEGERAQASSEGGVTLPVPKAQTGNATFYRVVADRLEGGLVGSGAQ